MKFSVGFLWMAWPLLAGLALSGCLPSTSKDEEKEPHYLAGKSRVNSMDIPGAIKSFEKAIEVNPQSAPAHFELALLFDTREPDPAAAIYHYEQYLKLAPNSDKADVVKTRILACKQQLAQAVSLGPVSEKLTHELERLTDENKRLHQQVEAYAARLQALTNQSGTASPPTRGIQPPVSNQLAALGASPSNSANSGRTLVAASAAARTHVVKPGETPILIARKYRVRLDALLAANPKLDSRRLRVGQTLTIPSP